MHQLAFTPCVHLSGFHSGADVCRHGEVEAVRRRRLPEHVLLADLLRRLAEDELRRHCHPVRGHRRL